MRVKLQNEQLGEIHRRVNGIVDKIEEGGLDYQRAINALQRVFDGEFALMMDLGIITVPEAYDHPTQLATFMEKNRKKFYGCPDSFNDANFPNPTRILKPGDKLWVRVFKQIVPGTTSSAERMAFLNKQKACYPGAQGLSLVLEQRADRLPKYGWYQSFDGDGCRVPKVNVSDASIMGITFNWMIDSFGSGWRDFEYFFCFCLLDEAPRT